MKINALYLTVFTAYKIDHLINETGIIHTLNLGDIHINLYAYMLICLYANYFVLFTYIIAF
ncbi:hypothetical protein GCM10025767_10830 [Thalassotalea piscium]